jgi:hypothetical protein
MSKKSHPGDGEQGKGVKGIVSASQPSRGVLAIGRQILRGLTSLVRS